MNGNPDCKRDDSVELPVRPALPCATPCDPRKNGSSQMNVPARRCVASKADNPRSSRRLSTSRVPCNSPAPPPKGSESVSMERLKVYATCAEYSRLEAPAQLRGQCMIGRADCVVAVRDAAEALVDPVERAIVQISGEPVDLISDKKLSAAIPHVIRLGHPRSDATLHPEEPLQVIRRHEPLIYGLRSGTQADAAPLASSGRAKAGSPTNGIRYADLDFVRVSAPIASPRSNPAD